MRKQKSQLNDHKKVSDATKKTIFSKNKNLYENHWKKL
jgi:hypothetical protein